MLGKGDRPVGRNEWLDKPTIVVGNKADIPGALDQFEVLENAFGDRYPVIMASAEEEVGFDEVALEIFEALKVIRVYTKSPRVRVEGLRSHRAAGAAHRRNRDRGRDPAPQGHRPGPGDTPCSGATPASLMANT